MNNNNNDNNNDSNNNNNNNNEILIKREPLVLPELGALYREKKEARIIQQQQQANPWTVH